MPDFVVDTASGSLAYEELDRFAKGYVEGLFFVCMCTDDGYTSANWSSEQTQEDIRESMVDGTLPSDVGVRHLHETSLAFIAKHCADFQRRNDATASCVRPT